MIFGPDGAPLADALPEDQEGLILAEIDIAMIPYAKAAADPTGHYSRPDVARLLFNPHHNPTVQRFGQSQDDLVKAVFHEADIPKPSAE